MQPTMKVTSRLIVAINIPSHLELSRLYRGDGKWSNGASIILWKSGRSLVWGVTSPVIPTPSHLHLELAVNEFKVHLKEMTLRTGSVHTGNIRQEVHAGNIHTLTPTMVARPCIGRDINQIRAINLQLYI